MEQIQFNSPMSAGTVNQGVIGESMEKSDLFPQMLKEQKSLGTTEAKYNKSDDYQGKGNESGPEDQNQQPLLLINELVTTMPAASDGSTETKKVGLNPSVAGNDESQNLLGEEDVGNASQTVLHLLGFEGSFLQTNRTVGNSNQVTSNTPGRPVPSMQITDAMTGSEGLPPALQPLQSNNLAPGDLSSLSCLQNITTLLPELNNESKNQSKNQSTGIQTLKITPQPMPISSGENVLESLVQPSQGMVSQGEQTAVGKGKTPVVQNITMFEQTSLPDTPKQSVSTLFTEILQPAKISGQEQRADNTGLRNTLDSGNAGKTQNTAQAIIPAQTQSADYSQPQTTAFSGVLGQTQNVEQLKAADQTQSAVRNQMTYQISSNFDKGNQEFEMQLYPKDLGKVNVKLTMEHSSLIVEICAVNSKAQSIILANADDIKAILQSQTNREVQISLPQEQKLTQHSFDDGNANQQNAYSSEEQRSEEKEEQQETDTDSFLNALNMFNGKYFRERSQEYGTS